MIIEVIDYQYERKAKDMMKFAARHMPNYVERVSGVDGMKAYEAKVSRTTTDGRPLITALTPSLLTQKTVDMGTDNAR